MTELFADGIRSIAVANGIVRVELVQLKRGQDATQAQLEPQVSGSLIFPVSSLKDFTLQVAKTLERLEQRNKERAKAADDTIEENAGSDMDRALEHL